MKSQEEAFFGILILGKNGGYFTILALSLKKTTVELPNEKKKFLIRRRLYATILVICFVELNTTWSFF